MSIQVTAKEYNQLNKYGYLSTTKQNLEQLKRNYRYIKYKSLNKLSCEWVLKIKINKNNRIYVQRKLSMVIRKRYCKINTKNTSSIIKIKN